MNNTALKDLVYKMADDQLILGHRNSEWIGLGPILEEDIAFASMAQDKVGQSLAFYSLLNQLGEGEPDSIAFFRHAKQFHCCHFVELPIGDYSFSLMRHFLFDTAEAARFELLKASSYEPLKNLAIKFLGESRYHTMHADTWMNALGKGTDESIERMQNALDECMPYALGIYEESEFETQLISDRVFAGELALREIWIERINSLIAKTDLILPDLARCSPAFGGRIGDHTEYLQPLLDEMSEVVNIDPHADW